MFDFESVGSQLNKETSKRVVVVGGGGVREKEGGVGRERKGRERWGERRWGL